MNYPQGWEVLGGGDGGEVTFAPKDGVVTQGGNTQVGFGAIAGRFALQKGRTDLRPATDDLVRKLKSENPKISVTGPGKTVSAGGLLTMLKQDSPFGGGEVDALFTLSRPDGLFFLVCVAPEKDYARVEPSFRQIMDSVKFP